jgi:hypothetical protein
MNTIDQALGLFHPVSLEEMECVKLMNRTDTKFIFSSDKLSDILDSVQRQYDILEIGGKRVHRYDSLYFDTPGFKCYLDHHNKHASRFKIRSRRYVDSGLMYLEIKVKNNKGRTRKERNKQHGSPEEITGKPEQLLLRETGLTPAMIQPSLQVVFNRTTLVDKMRTSRITIDAGLYFARGAVSASFPGIIIAEVKQDRNIACHFEEVLHRHHIHPFGISKYCLGLASLHTTLRHNNFKQKIHQINKLNHDISPTDHPVPLALVPGIAG